MLLARTTPLAEVRRKTEGMSVFLVDLRDAMRVGKGMTVRPIPNMVNHETNELFLRQPGDSGGESHRRGGQGLPLHPRRPQRRAHADRRRMHRRRLLVRRTRAPRTRRERVVFDRPIGKNQGVQFPIAERYIEVEAANLMRFKACELFDARQALRRGGQHGEAISPRRPRGRRPTSACRPTAASASPAITTSSASSARRACTRSRRSRPT